MITGELKSQVDKIWEVFWKPACKTKAQKLIKLISSVNDKALVQAI